MQYRCPKCQSAKLLPVTQPGQTTARPVVPKSLVFLIPAILILLLLVSISVAMWAFGNGAGETLQLATCNNCNVLCMCYCRLLVLP